MKTMEKKGFTLIELLIVIAIIGILAVAFLPSLLGAPAKGRDAQRIASVQKIENFVVSEMLTGTALPATGCIDPAGVAGTIGKLIADNIAGFGGVFPSDPKSDQTIDTGLAVDCANGQYGYIKMDNSTSYSAAVYATVEEESNANIKCGDIVDNVDPTLDPGGIVLAGVETGCFMALIQ